MKRKLQRDGFFKVIKLKNTYKPSEKKKEFFKRILKELKLNKLKIEYKEYRGGAVSSSSVRNLKVGGSNPSPATNLLNFNF